MARLSSTIAVAVFMVLVASIGHAKTVKRQVASFQVAQTNDVYGWICDNPAFAPYFSICQTTTKAARTSTTPKTTSTGKFSTSTDKLSTSTSTSTQSSTTTEDIEIIEKSSTTSAFELESTTTNNGGSDNSNTTLSGTALERAHWCQFNNGTYLPLYYTFMHTDCALCQCQRSRAIRCTTLQCMPTYCIDGSTPVRRSGQCCTQCAYEQTSTTCVQNGVSVPHGTIVKSTSDNVQCWCQLGSIECRKTSASVFSSMDIWGENTAVYVVVIVLGGLLLIGTLLCGGCTVFYYYYYKRNQETIQQAYDQYWNHAGWQPMGEEVPVGDVSAEEKQAEAEQTQVENQYPTGNSQEYIPPPYALYNGGYVGQEQGKDQKYV